MFRRKERPSEKAICAHCKYYEEGGYLRDEFYRRWRDDMCHAKDHPYETVNYISGAVSRGIVGSVDCVHKNWDGDCPDFVPRFECNLVVTPATRRRCRND